jgi:plastocyanin
MRGIGMALALLVGVWTMGVTGAAAHQVTVLDDCNPADYNAVPPPGGGCTLEEGDVTRAEFNAERFSPLADATIGHQAWRNDPAYLKIEVGDTVKVKNKGGRNHTFTEVAAFGGGTVPALNVGLDPAPECAATPTLAPGDSTKITALSVGNHRFQCCFHPWMRTLIKVLPDD